MARASRASTLAAAPPSLFLASVSSSTQQDTSVPVPTPITVTVVGMMAVSDQTIGPITTHATARSATQALGLMTLMCLSRSSVLVMWFVADEQKMGGDRFPRVRQGCLPALRLH